MCVRREREQGGGGTDGRPSELLLGGPLEAVGEAEHLRTRSTDTVNGHGHNRGYGGARTGEWAGPAVDGTCGERGDRAKSGVRSRLGGVACGRAVVPAERPLLELLAKRREEDADERHEDAENLRAALGSERAV